MGDLVDLLGDSVYRLSKAVTGDDSDAEDAAVETFLQIWERVPRHLADETATRWVFELACEVATAVGRASESRTRSQPNAAGRRSTPSTSPAAGTAR